MNKIQIADERIDQAIPVAFENIKAEIVEAKPQTFQTLDENGEVKEMTINVVQPGQTITLKDLSAEIGDLEIQLSQTQQRVDYLTAEIQKKRDLQIELTNIIQPAFDDLQVAISKKPTEEIQQEIL